MTNAPTMASGPSETIPVTVTHIALSKETYHEILSALDELQEAYGKTAEVENARRYLHYRWLLEGSRTSTNDPTPTRVE